MSTPHLFPVPNYQSGFTTNPHVALPSVIFVNLDDIELGVHKVSSRTSHKLVSPPSPSSASRFDLPPPSLAWEAVYPEGSINPTAAIPGGFGFYLSGPPSFAAKLKNGATEVVMSYRMMLEHGWEWVKGGKLPGLFGGMGESSYTSTGGRQHDRSQCFNLRLMWRPKGVGELYAYLPTTVGNTTRLLAVPPVSKENSDFGFSVGRGAFKFDIAAGEWISVAIRVKLNDIGAPEPNGEFQLWIDGVSVILATGLLLRDVQGGTIQGMHFQTFFGGHTNDWASPKDQRAWFSDVSGVIVD